MGLVMVVVSLLYYAFPIIELFVDEHADSFWWWLFALIGGSSCIFNAMIFTDSLDKHRCGKCGRWGLGSITYTDASYKRDVETTSYSRMSGDGKKKVVTYTHTDHGMEAVKVYRSLTMSHCKKCGAYYEVWHKGGKNGNGTPIDISQERYERSSQRYLNSDLLRQMPGKRRVKDSYEEKYIFLYGDSDNDPEVFPQALEEHAGEQRTL